MYHLIKTYRKTWFICFFDEKTQRFSEEISYVFNNLQQARKKLAELKAQ